MGLDPWDASTNVLCNRHLDQKTLSNLCAKNMQIQSLEDSGPHWQEYTLRYYGWQTPFTIMTKITKTASPKKTILNPKKVILNFSKKKKFTFI